MANLLSLKKRIQTAKNVSKTTRAMQMIATSKLKRAQDAAIQSRPYVENLITLSKGLKDKINEKNTHDYMTENTTTAKRLLIVVSPDKGLCGGMVSSLIKSVFEYDLANKDSIYITIGRKAELIVSKLGNKEIVASFPFSTSLPAYEMIFPIAKIVDEYYLEKKVSRVEILTTKFTNLFTQTPTTTTLLPITVSDKQDNKYKEDFMLFEPSLKNLLPTLLKRYTEMVLYQNLLESYASEQAARTIAMKNATDNATSVINELKLEYNKSRQEKITNEILDISGSSFALAYE